MIVVQLYGGLGNQLFQYAVGRHVALKSGQELRIDVLEFETYDLHKYSLGALNIQERFADRRDVRRLRPKGAAKLLRKGRVYLQSKAGFDPAVLALRGEWYIQGYWQSEKYFADIADLIRTEATVKTPLAGQDLAVAEAMARTESVALHVRRGDYVTDASTNQTPGTCSLAYYKAALAEVSAAYGNGLHVFVFSDDLPWAEQHLQLPFQTTLVGHNGPERNYEDLRLMSLAKHNIIANSSFSWWGAWLNRNPDKIVCAPRNWFNDATIDVRDFFAAGWKVIS